MVLTRSKRVKLLLVKLFTGNSLKRNIMEHQNNVSSGALLDQAAELFSTIQARVKFIKVFMFSFKDFCKLFSTQSKVIDIANTSTQLISIIIL